MSEQEPDEEEKGRPAGQVAVQVLAAAAIVAGLAFLYLTWRPAPTLTEEAHPTGWGIATCLGAECHREDREHHNREPYKCVGCHGANGASQFSLQTSGHAEGLEKCLADCHEVHSGESSRFPDPDSCRACHKPSSTSQMGPGR